MSVYEKLTMRGHEIRAFALYGAMSAVRAGLHQVQEDAEATDMQITPLACTLSNLVAAVVLDEQRFMPEEIFDAITVHAMRILDNAPSGSTARDVEHVESSVALMVLAVEHARVFLKQTGYPLTPKREH